MMDKYYALQIRFVDWLRFYKYIPSWNQGMDEMNSKILRLTF